MILDAFLLFSDAQALTATAVSTNVVDLTKDIDIGPGVAMTVMIELDVASDGTTGDETYTAALQTDDNEAFSSATTLNTITIPRSTAAGTVYELPVPETNERYLRLNYTLGGTTPTVTVTSTLMPKDGVSQYRAYARGYTVS